MTVCPAAREVHAGLLQLLGQRQPVVFSHGWPLNADAFENQMFFLAALIEALFEGLLTAARARA